MSIEVKENKIILKEHLKALSMMYLMPIQIHRYLSNGFHPQGAKTKVYRFNTAEGGKPSLQ